jgi:hypothetical protein
MYRTSYSVQIITEVASVTPQILENTWREIEYGLDIVLAENITNIGMY